MRNDWETMETGAFASAQEVKCPTLVIYDPTDPMVPQRHADWALSAIPGARACELHAGGHLSGWARTLSGCSANGLRSCASMRSSGTAGCVPRTAGFAAVPLNLDGSSPSDRIDQAP
jgi:hypothetical protein